jgi:hypothetical protein
MSGLTGNPSTSADGSYTGTVDYGWSGAVTPTKSGYTFSPSSVPYTNVTSNQAQNYTGALQTFTVSGYVRTLGNVGISGVVMSGLIGNPSTSADGSYTGTVDYGWSGTVTPQKSGYTFSPSSVPYTNVTSNQSQNYTGTLQALTISGYVRTSGGAGISGVVMSGLIGNPSTSADGSYTGTVDYGWSGTVTPTKFGYTFSPSSVPYTNVTSNQAQNYTGALQTFTISGYVRTSGGVGISGVTMNGLSGNPSSSTDGSYTATVDYGWSGTVTPTKAGYTFSSSSQSYSNVTSSQTQNYTGALQSFTVSGYVRTSGGSGISGVVMSGLTGNPSTAADGSYTGTVDYGWSGTVTPTKSGYTFSSSSQSYSNVTSNQTQNYTGTVQTFTISGYVRTSGGAGISGVVMSGLTGNPSTAVDGSYTATVNYGWSGTVTPTKSGYTFSSSSVPYTNVTSNQSQNYTGTVQTLSISGYVRTSGGSGISGVTMSGLTGNPSTSADGSYTGTVDYGWSGTVTPTKSGYSFSPSSTPYTNVTSNQAQNNTGTVQTFTISGYVRTSGGAGISGVVMSGLTGNPSTAVDGSYTATVNYGWSGTVIPTKFGYTFSPSSVPYTNVTSNQTQNNTGAVQQYTLTVNITGSGSVTMTPDKATYVHGETAQLTASAGTGYTFCNWSGGVSSSTNPTTLSINGNQTISANFTEIKGKISPPKTPKGSSKGTTGKIYDFSTGVFSTGNLQGVEYQFDWKGDGTDLSSWGSATQSKLWTSASTHYVIARARYKNLPDVVSSWSNSLTVTVTEVPFIHIASPNGGEVWLVGRTHTISWASGYLNPNGTIHIFYWYDKAWHPIAELPSTATSFDWTIPDIHSGLETVIPDASARFTSIWIGNWVNNQWECWDSNDRSFKILDDGWIFKISGADKGGTALWFDFDETTNENIFDGYGISLGLGVFGIKGSCKIDSKGGAEGTYTLHDFYESTNVFYSGNLTGKINQNATKITLALNALDGTPIFGMAGVRLLNETAIPKNWVVDIGGSARGILDLIIEPYQTDREVYPHIFRISGPGSIPDFGLIDIEGFFFLAPGNKAYGIYEISGAVTETGVFSGKLNTKSERFKFDMMSDNGNTYTYSGQNLKPQ